MQHWHIFLCGFVGHFKIKYMFCVKAYKKSLTQEGGGGDLGRNF